MSEEREPDYVIEVRHEVDAFDVVMAAVGGCFMGLLLVLLAVVGFMFLVGPWLLAELQEQFTASIVYDSSSRR